MEIFEEKGAMDYLPHLTYACVGKEVGEEGTPHLQGYLEFSSLKTRNWISKKIPRAYIEVAYGSPQENRTYCSKSGQIILEVGQIKQQGKRKDLDEVKEMIDDGASIAEVREQHFGTWVRNRQSLEIYASAIRDRPEPPRYTKEEFPIEWQEIDEGDIQTLVLWGKTGIGKTSFARSLLPNAMVVSHIDQLQSFDSTTYDGIIFDDMDFLQWPRTSQIHLTDWEENRAIHRRYGVTVIPAYTPKIFTTNEFRGSIFVDDPAIKRRVKVVELIK